MLAGDENEHTDPCWLNFAIIALCAAIMWHMMTLGQSGLQHFVFNNALVHPAGPVADWSWGHLLASAVTCIFLHGGIGHLLGNSFFLLVFGDNIEYAFGRWRYMLFFLLCGFFSSWAQFFTMLPSGIPLVGMSGAIAGVLGAYARIFPTKKVRLLFSLFTFRIGAFWYMAFWFAGNLVSSILVYGTEKGGVAFFAHMGGFLLGYIMAPLFRDPGVGLYERVAVPQALYPERFAYLNKLRRKPRPDAPVAADKIVIDGNDITGF